MKRLHLNVFGRVQGVMFRSFVQQNAIDLGISGRVRNRADGSVEVTAEGEPLDLETLLELCRAGPPYARVDRVEVEWLEATREYSDFTIRY